MTNERNVETRGIDSSPERKLDQPSLAALHLTKKMIKQEVFEDEKVIKQEVFEDKKMIKQEVFEDENVIKQEMFEDKKVIKQEVL